MLERCASAGAEVRILSRDEKKQYDLAQKYKQNKKVKFYLGDIRDKRTVDNAMYGVDYVFHAAAMKQVPSCEQFPMEAVKTNILGSDNVLISAIHKRVKKVVCLSTDKAVYPTSAMGMSKAYMERLAFQKAAEQDRTKICVTRFGNLIASRGSAVPLFIEQVQNGLPITITDPDMTRYMMTVDDAITLVEKAFEIGENGDLFVKKASACTTGDLANAVCRYLELTDEYPIETIGIRPGEKLHESLLTEEEMSMAEQIGNYFVVHTRTAQKNRMHMPGVTLNSKYADRMSEDDVLGLITNVFGPWGGVIAR